MDAKRFPYLSQVLAAPVAYSPHDTFLDNATHAVAAEWVKAGNPEMTPDELSALNDTLTQFFAVAGPARAATADSLKDKKKIHFYDIEWDTEGEQTTLPPTCDATVDKDFDVDAQGADWLSDKFGWTVKGFRFKVM